MKLLNNPPTSPYLYVGSMYVAPLERSTEAHLQEAAHAWLRVSAEVADNRQLLAAVCRRMETRRADPSFAEHAMEIFYTLRENGRDQLLIEYYI